MCSVPDPGRDRSWGYPLRHTERRLRSFEEKIKGSIEVGKLADMIVLSDNILKIDPMNIADLNVDLTMIDGIVEYERRREGWFSLLWTNIEHDLRMIKNKKITESMSCFSIRVCSH